MKTPALDIENLSHTYTDQHVPSLSGINLTIGEGEKFGLLGPNGAGKTTLMNIITGLLPLQQGDVKIFGQSINKRHKEQHKLIGFIPQDFAFYHELSPKQNLEFFGAWSGLTKSETQNRIDELLQVTGLTDVKDKPVAKFSGGMKRRINLAIGVIHKPRILFLDEPTVGVDVQSRHAILNHLNQLNSQGTTLIYTSHQLNEAEQLCDRIAFIEQGKIIATDTLTGLLQTHNQPHLEGVFITLAGKDLRDE